jgi:PAS domain S-box-containing protein
LWLKAIVVAFAYLAAAELGNALSVEQQFSTFWPPAGVLRVLLVLADPREWPILLLAAATANISSDLMHDRALLVGLGFATANCAEATLGAFLLRRLVGVPVVLDTRRRVLGFSAFAAGIAPALGASIGTAVLAAAYGVSPWWRTWVTWWSGDALGVFAVGAFAFAVADVDRRRRRGEALFVRPSRIVGGLALVALTCTIGWWVSAAPGPLTGWKFAVFLPALLVAALFGMVGAASTGLALTLAMTIGFGVRWSRVLVASGSISDEIIVLQAFLAAVIFADLFVAATIEESRAAEAAAHVAAEKYRVLLETLPIGVSISDDTGMVIETSERAAEVLGVATEEHRQRRAQGAEWKILWPDGSPKPSEEWTSSRALANRSRERGQEGMIRPDGSTVWLDVTAAPIPLEGFGVAIAYQDITDEVAARESLVQSERSLKEARDHLEDEVSKRTAELRLTNDELVDASAAKSRFLANMSHELRTPLNSIIGFADVMEKGLAGPLTDEQRTQLGMIHGSGMHLLGLVNEILDLERVETGNVSITLTRFDLCALTREVGAALEQEAHAKGIELRVECPEEPLELCSDQSRVRQVLFNLAANAVKFTGAGEVTLRCVADGPGMRLTVTDTGIGISPEELGPIMDDFHQVDRSDGMKPSGTGLGLSISQRLVAILGGRLEAESEFGSGSTFRVWLPDLPEGPS